MHGEIKIGHISDGVNTTKASYAVVLLVMTSYLIQFFNRIIGSKLPYLVFVIMAIILLMLANVRLVVNRKSTIAKMWMVFAIVVAASIGLHVINISYIMDLGTYLVGIVFIEYLGRNTEVYEKVFKVIIFFSVIYAISVFIQFLAPSVYSIYLNLLPSEISYNINSLKNSYGYTGFSTNPGFTAGHIVSGILVLFAIKVSNMSFNRHKSRIALIILIIALLLTGKRAHLLVVIFSCIVCYLICTRGKKKLLFINALLWGSCVVIPMLLVSSEIVSSIPVLARFSETFNGLLSGADVSNGRNKLSAYAWDLFKENPIFGIGWGQYRYSIVGTVTLMTEMDTHNIYLQSLCETGLVGFLSFVIAALLSLKRSFHNLKTVLEWDTEWSFFKMICIYSLGYQLFFLLYGISGNPLYDINYILMYFVSVSMTAVCSRELSYII